MDDPGFLGWCQDNDHTDVINETLYDLYKKKTQSSTSTADESKDATTKNDAEVTEGG